MSKEDCVIKRAITHNCEGCNSYGTENCKECIVSEAEAELLSLHEEIRKLREENKSLREKDRYARASSDRFFWFPIFYRHFPY